MRKLLLSVVALFAMSAQNAFAINLTFQFDVNSSGPSIYACNAGIKHQATANVCYDRNSKKPCSLSCANGNISACTAESSTPQQCVCTGEDLGGTQGTWRLDYLNANTTAWTDNQVSSVGNTPHQISGTNTDTFSQIFASKAGQPSAEAYGNVLKDLSINLGSEIYNAEYFVDICYRGPQIDYRNNGKTVDGLNFALKARTTVIDIKDTKYAELAGLKVKATAKCIMNDDFSYCDGDKIPGLDVGCGTQAGTYYNFSQNSAGDDGYVSIGQTINTRELLANAAMKSSDGKNITPRFCQIRYSFKETFLSTETAIRKWNLQQARICTYTELSEPSL